jgi:pimeloyl-ACP methyl ester carboxylesterase
MAAPAIRYATSRDGTNLAWTQFGEGEVDVLWLTGFVSHLEVLTEYPPLRSFNERLGRFARVVTYDKRGMGLSDRPGGAPTMEEHADDALAVMDAAGLERPTLVAVSEGGPAAIVLAASHPSRVSKLVLYGTFPRMLSTGDYPPGMSAEVVEQIQREAPVRWGQAVAMRGFGPSVADDPVFAAWWGRLLRAGTSPAGIAALIGTWLQLDVRPALPLIGVPTLVLCRRGDRMAPAAHSEYLAEHIPGAQLKLLDGDDHLLFTGDTESVLRELHDFITGIPGGPVPQQVLNIVGSTEQAARLGDERWAALLERHDELFRRQLERWHGRAVKQLGDGFLATFDGPARAVRCLEAFAADVRSLGLEVRAGVHTGECELRGDDITGMAVNIGARVGAEAGPGEILVSGTVRDLVVGSDIPFEDRGTRELKGVPGEWRIYALAEAVSSLA